MTVKKDEFPKTMVETQCLLSGFKVPPRQLSVRGLDSNGVTFVQDGGGNWQPPTAPPTKDIDCWHCGLKGHYKSNCPKLQVQELDVGVQNLNIEMCEEAHSLFSANEGWGMVQEEKKETSGVQGILLKHHVYINT